MRTVVACTVLLSALGAAWSSCACASRVAVPDAPAASRATRADDAAARPANAEPHARTEAASDAPAEASPAPAGDLDALQERQPAWAVQRTWRIELSDRTMRSALARWARLVGWQLVWEAPGDFGIDAEASVHGTFDDALRSVVGALAHSNAPIQAILYRGNQVLRIVSKGAG